MLFLAFPIKTFNFVNEKLAKTLKMLFSNTHNIRFLAQGSSKTIFREDSYDQISIYRLLNVLSDFPRKWFHFHHSETCKKLKNALFKLSQPFLLSSRLLLIHFLRRFSCPNFDFNSFESFASLSQNKVSTSSQKNLQRTGKCFVKTLTTFGFELKLFPKPFYFKSFMPKF